jgi:hypothetical protein
VSSGFAKRQPVRTNTTILGFAEGAMQKISDLTDDFKKKVQKPLALLDDRNKLVVNKLAFCCQKLRQHYSSVKLL